MTKRDHAIARARIAGYHEDTKDFTRLIIESRVNRQVMNEAFQSGRRAKTNGVKCNCYQCNHQTT